MMWRDESLYLKNTTTTLVHASQKKGKSTQKVAVTQFRNVALELGAVIWGSLDQQVVLTAR